MGALGLEVDGRAVRLKAHKCLLEPGPPPNSLSALRTCLAAGVEAMEVDLCVLGDGEFLVVHGPELSEETTGRGPASAIGAEAARALRIVDRGRVHDERPPLLGEVVAALGGATGLLQLDLKDGQPLPPDAVARLAGEIAPVADRLIVSGGSAENVLALARAAPGVRVGFDPLLRFDLARGRYRGPLAPPGEPAHLPAAALAEVFDRIWAAMPSAWIWYVRATLLERLAEDGFDLIGWLSRRGVAEVDAWTIDLPAAGERRARALGLFRTVVRLGATQVTTNTARAWLAAPELA